MRCMNWTSTFHPHIHRVHPFCNVPSNSLILGSSSAATIAHLSLSLSARNWEKRGKAILNLPNLDISGHITGSELIKWRVAKSSSQKLRLPSLGSASCFWKTWEWKMRSSYDYRFGSWQLKEVHPLTALPNGHNWTHGHWGVLSYVDAREMKWKDN